MSGCQLLKSIVVTSVCTQISTCFDLSVLLLGPLTIRVKAEHSGCNSGLVTSEPADEFGIRNRFIGNPRTSFRTTFARWKPLSRAHLLIPILWIAAFSSLATTFPFLPYSVAEKSKRLISLPSSKSIFKPLRVCPGYSRESSIAAAIVAFRSQ